MTHRLPDHISRRLRLPLIAAPMLQVSGIDLVVAACRNGVIGAFPTANARTHRRNWTSGSARSPPGCLLRPKKPRRSAPT